MVGWVGGQILRSDWGLCESPGGELRFFWEGLDHFAEDMFPLQLFN